MGLRVKVAADIGKDSKLSAAARANRLQWFIDI
jgi:hypothetical protein